MTQIRRYNLNAVLLLIEKFCLFGALQKKLVFIGKGAALALALKKDARLKAKFEEVVTVGDSDYLIGVLIDESGIECVIDVTAFDTKVTYADSGGTYTVTVNRCPGDPNKIVITQKDRVLLVHGDNPDDINWEEPCQAPRPAAGEPQPAKKKAAGKPRGERVRIRG